MRRRRTDPMHHPGLVPCSMHYFSLSMRVTAASLRRVLAGAVFERARSGCRRSDVGMTDRASHRRGRKDLLQNVERIGILLLVLSLIASVAVPVVLCLRNDPVAARRSRIRTSSGSAESAVDRAASAAKKQNSIHLCLYLAVVLMQLLCYGRTRSTHPGRASQWHRARPDLVFPPEPGPGLKIGLADEYESRLEEGRSLVQDDSATNDAAWRYCEPCRAPKPPRTSHCRACKECVLRYDHHCVWTGCCIGLFNVKVLFSKISPSATAHPLGPAQCLSGIAICHIAA